MKLSKLFCLHFIISSLHLHGNAYPSLPVDTRKFHSLSPYARSMESSIVFQPHLLINLTYIPAFGYLNFKGNCPVISQHAVPIPSILYRQKQLAPQYLGCFRGNCPVISQHAVPITSILYLVYITFLHFKGNCPVPCRSRSRQSYSTMVIECLDKTITCQYITRARFYWSIFL